MLHLSLQFIFSNRHQSLLMETKWLEAKAKKIICTIFNWFKVKTDKFELFWYHNRPPYIKFKIYLAKTLVVANKRLQIFDLSMATLYVYINVFQPLYLAGSNNAFIFYSCSLIAFIQKLTSWTRRFKSDIPQYGQERPWPFYLNGKLK